MEDLIKRLENKRYCSYCDDYSLFMKCGFCGHYTYSLREQALPYARARAQEG